MSFVLSAITCAAPEMIATATLTVRTNGQGFTEITREAARFLSQAEAGEGSLLLFMRHTSASLVIQEKCRSGRANRSRHGTCSRRAARCRLDSRYRGAGRHARPCQDDAHRRFAAGTGECRRARSGHLARRFRRRASRSTAPPRNTAAIYWHAPLIRKPEPSERLSASPSAAEPGLPPRSCRQCPCARASILPAGSYGQPQWRRGR